MKRVISTLALGGILLLPLSLPAIDITAIDSGFVTAVGGSAKGDGTIAPPAKYNYSVGVEEHYSDGSLGTPPGTKPLAFHERRNYFVFDLTGIAGTILDATLTIDAGTLESADALETFALVEITDPDGALGLSEALLAGFGGGSSAFDEPTDPLVGDAMALFSKIGDGPLDLATVDITSADDDTLIDLTFTPAGLSYLNTIKGPGGKKILLGGALLSITGSGVTEQPFGFTGPDYDTPSGFLPTLAVTVPEPSAYASVLACSGMFLVLLRRRVG